MAKTSKEFALLAMIRQHDQLWEEWGRRIVNGEEDMRELSAQCIELAFEITLTQPHTARGRAGKRRIMRLQEFEDNHGFFDWVLARDADRVTAARKARAKGAP